MAVFARPKLATPNIGSFFASIFETFVVPKKTQTVFFFEKTPFRMGMEIDVNPRFPQHHRL